MSECSKHPQWIGTDLQWRCPHCAAEPSIKPKPTNRRSKPDYGSPDKRLSGYARLRRNDRIRERDGFQCKHCGVAVRRGEVDHIIALKDGGSEEDSNCQLLCSSCHGDKTRKDMGYKAKPAFGPDGIPLDGSW